MDVTPRPDLVMVRGSGSLLWDDRGKRYLDFVQGWAVNALGHAPAEIREALTSQAGQLLTPSPAFYNEPALELAHALGASSGLERVFFCNSGAEANEGAIKLARKWGARNREGAFEVITATGSFHGRTLATMAASGKPGFDAIFPPAMPGFVKVPFGDVEAAANAVGPRTAAIMVEPIQGEAGVIVPPDGYLRALRALCDERGLLLIADEVQTGVGRTGRMYGSEWDGVRPDVMTLGKGLGGGVPLAALLAAESASCFEHGDQGGTFNGNPLMTAVGRVVHGIVSAPGFLTRVGEASDRLMAGLRARAERLGGSVRGRGLLVALELPTPGAVAVRDACFERGLLVNAPRPATLRFMPSLRVSDAEIDEALTVLDDALGAAAP
jgi:acetylornithine/N-succinyldiaminopimelate aminotransferase